MTQTKDMHTTEAQSRPKIPTQKSQKFTSSRTGVNLKCEKLNAALGEAISSASDPDSAVDVSLPFNCLK